MLTVVVYGKKNCEPDKDNVEYVLSFNGFTDAFEIASSIKFKLANMSGTFVGSRVGSTLSWSGTISASVDVMWVGSINPSALPAKPERSEFYFNGHASIAVANNKLDLPEHWVDHD
mmetsp:Transcript_19144/g.47781  ORF Transcript_19144/g.47781 Transcript_19144/m.47781 type:complete len:116 (+) Transcript_19144:154-501(+)